MRTHDVGRAFVHTIPLRPRTPLVTRADTNEIDVPFRYSHSYVIHFWRGHGLVLGWWTDTGRDEDTALLTAIGAHGYSAVDDEGVLLDEFH